MKEGGNTEETARITISPPHCGTGVCCQDTISTTSSARSARRRFWDRLMLISVCSAACMIVIVASTILSYLYINRTGNAFTGVVPLFNVSENPDAQYGTLLTSTDKSMDTNNFDPRGISILTNRQDVSDPGVTGSLDMDVIDDARMTKLKSSTIGNYSLISGTEELELIYNVKILYRVDSDVLPSNVLMSIISSKKMLIGSNEPFFKVPSSGVHIKFWALIATLDIRIRNIEIDGRPYSIIIAPKLKNPLIPIYMASKYFILPHLIFEDASRNEAAQRWYLTEEVEVIYWKNKCTIDDLRVVVRDVIAAIQSTRESEYFVEDFEALDIFVTRDAVTEEINSAKLFNNGNFVLYHELSEEAKGNYIRNCKWRIMRLIRDLTLLFQDNLVFTRFCENSDGTVAIRLDVDHSLVDFYVVLSDRSKNEVNNLSDMLNHPFITKKPMELDPYGERVESKTVGEYIRYGQHSKGNAMYDQWLSNPHYSPPTEEPYVELHPDE